jgi:serine/threonine protein kinase
MSPEQVKSTKDVTLQSDIYSLGVVLWQMVSGRKPYESETSSTFELQTKIVNEKLPYTSNIFDSIIQTSTAKELNHRFKNCNEIKSKFDNIQIEFIDYKLANSENNNDKTLVETIKDNTIVETIKDSSLVPNRQVDTPNNQSIQTKSSPVGYIVIIFIIIIIGAIISNNNSYEPSAEETATEVVEEVGPVIEEYAEEVVTPPDTAGPAFIHCNDGKQIPSTYYKDGECDCANCEDE